MVAKSIAKKLLFIHKPTYYKSRWSLLSGVYARGSKRSLTGGKSVTCRGLHILTSTF